LANDYFNTSGYPSPHAAGVSASLRQELSNIGAGFDKLPSLAGHANEIVVINGAGTGMTSGTAVALGLLTAAAAAAAYLPLAGGTVTGAFAANGGVTLGDAAGDALTINSNTATIPNGLTFSAAVTVSGAFTANAGATMASTGGQVALVNSTHVDGSYVGFSNSGAPNGFVGAAKPLVTIFGGGASPATDFALRSQNSLWLAINGSTPAVKIDTAGRVGIGVAAAAGILLDVAGAIRGTSDAGLRLLNAAQNNGATVAAINGVNTGLRLTSDGGPILLNAGGTDKVQLSAGGVFSYGGIEIGFRGMASASVTTGSPVATDAGKCVYASAGVTIPNSTFAGGDVLTIYNDTGGNITITATITTLRWAGTATTGNRTLAQRGIATVLFRSGTEAIISGSGLS